MTDEAGSPLVRQRRLATELRRLRERLGLTGDEVASDLGWSPSRVSRYELGRVTPKPPDLKRLLNRYGVSPQRQEQLQALAAEATERGWWDSYADVLNPELSALIAMEAEATSSASWTLDLIPGLLQTERYAREANRGYAQLVRIPPRQMERRLEARMARQRVLRREPPFELSFVIDESALRRRIAGNEVMREQLLHLTELAGLSNVRLQVLTLDAVNPVVTSSFVLLQFAEAHGTRLPDVVYAEGLVRNFYFEEEEETFSYDIAFRELSRAALDPAASVGLISRIAETTWA